MAEEPKVQVMSLPADVRGDGWTMVISNGEDDISCRVEQPAVLRSIRCVLTTAPSITWWKAVEIWDKRTNTKVRSAEAQDANHGPVECYLPIDNFDRFDNYKLILAKAKFAGVHWPMYEFPGDQIFEKTIYFRWDRDG